MQKPIEGGSIRWRFWLFCVHWWKRIHCSF